MTWLIRQELLIKIRQKMIWSKCLDFTFEWLGSMCSAFCVVQQLFVCLPLYTSVHICWLVSVSMDQYNCFPACPSSLLYLCSPCLRLSVCALTSLNIICWFSSLMLPCLVPNTIRLRWVTFCWRFQLFESLVPVVCLLEKHSVFSWTCPLPG